MLTVEDIRALVRAWRSRSDRSMAVIVDPLDTVCPDMGSADILAFKSLAAGAGIPVILSAPCIMKKAEDETYADVILDWELVDEESPRGCAQTRITVQKNRFGTNGWKIGLTYLMACGGFLSKNQWDDKKADRYAREVSPA